MIDNLPNGWRIEELNKCGKIVTGKTPSKRIEEYWNSNDISFIKPDDFNKHTIIEFDKGKDFISHEGFKKATKVPPYSVLVTCIGNIGNILINKNEATTNQQINSIIPNKDIDYKYLAYAIKKIKPIMIDRANAPVVPIINKTDFGKFTIPIPPLQQQEKIVKVLDLSSNLIEKQKELLKNYDLFLKSKFIEMFGNPSKNVMNWNIEKFEKYIEYIGDIGSNGSNAVISKNLKMLDTVDYALMIRTTNLNKNDFINDVKYVSEETYNFFKKSKIFGGEIIMNKIGSAGKFWKMPYLNKPVSLGLNQLVIRLKNLNTEYLYYLLSTEYGQLVISSKTNGAVTQSITKGAVKDIDIMIPPIELQNKFASIVEKIEIIKEKENQKLKQLEDLHNSLMQKAFKGEIE